MHDILCKFYIFCTLESKKQISPIEKKNGFFPDSLLFGGVGWGKEYQKTILASEALNAKK